LTSHTIGADCNLILQHPNVFAGAEFGFILQPDPRDLKSGPVVQVQREVDSDANSISKIYFTIMLADNLVNPDGTLHTESRATMLDYLIQYLQQPSELLLGFSGGWMPDLSALGHVSTEMHYGDYSLVSCQLTNRLAYFPAADPIRFYASAWDGALTWATSYWR
jgi:hypothetical protein